jgi:hypothetical protein
MLAVAAARVADEAVVVAKTDSLTAWAAQRSSKETFWLKKHAYETDKSQRNGVIIVRGGTVKTSYSKYKYDSEAENSYSKYKYDSNAENVGCKWDAKN